MKKLFLAVIFMAFLVNLFAGNYPEKDSTRSTGGRSYLEFALAGSFLLDEDAGEDFNAGWGGNFQLRFETPKQKVSFVPLVRFRIFTHPLESDNEVKNQLSFINIGLQVDYKILQSANKKFAFLALVEVSHTWVDDRLTWNVETNNVPYSYNYNQNSNTKREHFNIFRGSAFSILGGIILRYDHFYIQADYDFLKSKVFLSDEFKSELNQDHVTYDSEFVCKLNTFNLNFGVSIPFEELSFRRRGIYRYNNGKYN